MKVRELKRILENLPDTMEIILQKDAEGNGYSPLRGADPFCIYVPENTYSGSVFSVETSAEHNGLEENEWEKLKKKPKALVLFPIN